MRKIIGVIGNIPIGRQLLKRINDENVVINNLEIKNNMRDNYLQLPQDYVESFNTYKAIIDKNYFDKPKSKFHK